MSVYGIKGQGWTVISSEPSSANELYHHGIIGMKWGIRRYQNKDGTLTEAGKRRQMDESSDSYYTDKNANRRNRGRYFNDQGHTTAGTIAKGVVTSVVIKKVFDKIGQVACKAIQGAGNNPKHIAALYSFVKLGKTAANVVNWGYQVRKIQDMNYAKKYDAQWRLPG